MDNQHIQQHIQTVREALVNYPEPQWVIYDGSHESDAYHAIEDNKLEWLQTSIDLLEKQQKEIERLQIALHSHQSFDKTVTELEAEVKRLQESLGFYADPTTYDIDHLDKHGYTIIDQDGGKKARVALGIGEE